MTDPREIIYLAIEEMAKTPRKYSRESRPDEDIFENLDEVRRSNTAGWSICRDASGWLEEIFPDFLKEHGLQCSVFSVQSSIRNHTGHYANMAKIEGMEPVICDLTASQFFNRPMEALKEPPFFVGTRDEISDVIKLAQKNTLDVICEAFPEHEFRNLLDVDYFRYRYFDFDNEVSDLLKGTECSCFSAKVGSFFYAMEDIWGERSILDAPSESSDGYEPLIRAYEQAQISDLTKDFDPAIPDLFSPYVNYIDTSKIAAQKNAL